VVSQARFARSFDHWLLVFGRGGRAANARARLVPEKVWGFPTERDSIEFLSQLDISRPSTPIVAAASPSAPRSSAVIRVRDSGMGIAPEILPRIFDLFVQADPGLDRSQGGLGIGLTMVRRLVEMHGGAVSAFSDGPGMGNEFVVRLPLAPAESAPSRANDATPSDRARTSRRPCSWR
jgi:signal transduction histidine kinase